MPVTPTYPGIYIEEIPSSAHTVTAAPTSVTVFVGYTHPFKTKPSNWDKAIQIFSFTDYEREFGGLFSVGWLADDVGRAVSEFFLSGGAVAWVVALPAQFFDLTTQTSSPVTPPVFDLPGGAANTGIRFTGLEPVDAHRLLTVSVTNLRATTGASPLDLADIVVTYGSRTETFRRVTLNPSPPVVDQGNTLEARIGTAAAPVSTLVTVAPMPGDTYPTAWPSPLGPQPLTQAFPANPFTTYTPGDFTPAFAQDASLDKVPVFNLLLPPGVWDQPVVSEALAFAEQNLWDPKACPLCESGVPLVTPSYGPTVGYERSAQ